MSWKKLSILTLSIFALAGSVSGQSLDTNHLALHNGAEYYVLGFNHHSLGCGTGKYYPSFTHWAAQGDGRPVTWPWKIRGWTWKGMQAFDHGPTWTWVGALMYSVDDPWSTTMTWPYPVHYSTGTVDHYAQPWPVFHTMMLPPSLPTSIAGLPMAYPSSYGGLNWYFNIFAVGSGTWIIPSTWPLYGYDFAFVLPPASSITLPSTCSIYQYSWENRGPFRQYQLLSGNEMDCGMNQGGNKGKSQSIGWTGELSTSFYYWINACSGVDVSWDMSLLVNDAVTIPVNVPGAANDANPFASYGFDVGVATVTPHASSGKCSFRFMTEDYAHPGTGRVILAAMAQSGPTIPYGIAGYRIAHGWDCTTNFFLYNISSWFHQVDQGYPASSFGTTVGGHSAAVPLPAHPVLVSLEFRFSSFSTSGGPPSASFMVTYF